MRAPSKLPPDPAREILLARLRVESARAALLKHELDALGVEISTRMITPAYAGELLDRLYGGAEDGQEA